LKAERTDEHLQYFREDQESVYFNSDEELLMKVRYYLAHPEDRQRIAEAGRRRCLESGYSTHHRALEMLNIIEKVCTRKVDKETLEKYIND
jgi:spore maturation protein CgeB